MHLLSLTILCLTPLAFPPEDTAAPAGKPARPVARPAAPDRTPGARTGKEPRRAETEASRLQLLDEESTLVTIIDERDIPARVEGVLSSVDVREGQIVTAQTLLGTIDDAEARLTHERASIEHDIAAKQAHNDLKGRIAKKAAIYAKNELRRSLDSNAIKQDAVTESEIDRQRLTLEKAELEYEQAVIEQETAELTRRLKETEMKLALQAVERRKITSPIAGVVVQINNQQGEWVEAGKTVFRVLRLDRLRVEGFLLAKNVAADLQGRRVTLQVDLPEKPGSEFGGQLVFVSPEIDAVNQTVRVWAEIENTNLLLRPGMRGKISIHAADSPAVPR